jgi:carboxylesterase
VVTIAAPVFLYRFFPWQATDWRLPLVPLLRFVRPMWPTGGSSEQAREIAPWQGYEGAQPLHALNSFLRGLRQVRAGLPRIESPVLTLHAEGDQTVLVDNAWEIMRRVRARIRRLELFRIRERTTSHHVLTTHRETRDRVAASVAGFIQDCVAPGS